MGVRDYPIERFPIFQAPSLVLAELVRQHGSDGQAFVLSGEFLRFEIMAAEAFGVAHRPIHPYVTVTHLNG